VLEFSPTATQTASTFRYTNHTFRSRLANPVCVTAELTPACVGGVQLYSAVYIGTFNPSDVLAGFAAHSGTSAPSTYSFTPPGGNAFAIVVHTTTPDTNCSSYSLHVTSFGPWADQAPAIVGNAPAVGSSITGNNAQWVTTAKQPEDLVYKITKALWSDETRKQLDAGHAKGKLITAKTATTGLGIPLHPGAEKFYKEAGLLK